MNPENSLGTPGWRIFRHAALKILWWTGEPSHLKIKNKQSGDSLSFGALPQNFSHSRKFEDGKFSLGF